jgi:hypothetical protein
LLIETLTESYKTGSEVIDNVLSLETVNVVAVAMKEYATAVSQPKFIEVKGNPTIDVKVTGLDAGVSDVVKTYVANEIAKSIKVTASDSSGYSVGEGKK